MADLRAVVEGLGFTDVATLLNSGNLVYTASVAPASAAASIEKAIAEELEVESRVTALAAADLRSILDENPLAGKADNPSRHLIGVSADPKWRQRAKTVADESWKPEAIAVGKLALYLWCPDGVHTSPLVKAVDKALNKDVTTRTWNTMQKLCDLAERIDE